jgi:dTDP-4-dehydrorhamnose reductase
VSKDKVLVLGKNGQLGSEIFKRIYLLEEYDFFFPTSKELNIKDFKAVGKFVNENKINIILNCAAYTAVEKAEAEEEEAEWVNATAVQNLANICKENKMFFIHISTDYVFDGNINKPIKEDMVPNPSGVYGKTKLAGESHIVNSGCHYLIFRVSWLYSLYGNNFVKTIYRLSSERDSLDVVCDQIGSPTSASDFASFLIGILKSKTYKKQAGIYHFSNEGVCSWYDFAYEIVKTAKYLCRINPVLSEDFPSLVQRPCYAVLDKTKIKRDFNIKIPHWTDSLRKVIQELQKKHVIYNENGNCN